MNNQSEIDDEWGIVMDEFRKTDIYRKSNGINLFPLFYEWLVVNYTVKPITIK